KMILVVKPQNINTLKEGSIVVVNVKNINIGHILLATGCLNGQRYLITCPLKFPKIDELTPAQNFVGLVFKSYHAKFNEHKIKREICPFIFLVIKNLISFSYFLCVSLYFLLKFNFYKIYVNINTLIREIKKWLWVWLSYIIRRL
ncbi:MAG: hypothetical protein ACK4NF_05860, partial [Planctomycetota bacterium]